MKTMKKLLVAFVVVCMVIVLPNFLAMANNTPYVPQEGNGTEDAPYWLDQGPATQYQVAIPAGETIYAMAFGTAGYDIIVPNSLVTVTYNGEVYEAEDGLVTVPTVADPISPKAPIYFQLTNTHTEGLTVIVAFDAPPAELGTADNPEVLVEAIGGTAALKEGDQDGYYYSYVATGEGQVIFEVYGAPEGIEYDLVVTNMRSYAQRTLMADSVTDDYGTHVAIDVREGDELQIQVVVLPDMDNGWKIAAADIAWGGYFQEKVGTAGNPISLEDMTTTQKVPAGASLYYSTYYFGTTMTITAENAFAVLYGEEEINSIDGVVSFDIPAPQGMGRPQPVIFEIVNESTKELTCEVEFAYPDGHQENPKEIVDDDVYNATVAAGTQGYYYTFTAPADGQFSISIWAADENENTLGWFYTMSNLTARKYGDNHHSDDDPCVDGETLDVKKGDEIIIIVNTYDPENPWAPPAGIVSIYATFVYPEGSESNPIAPEDLVTTHKVPTGTTYFQTYNFGTTMLVTAKGEFIVVLDEKEYVAVDGVATVEIPASTGMGRPMAAVFQIVNKGTEELECEIEFVYPKGDCNNPDEVEAGKHEADIKEGAGEYHYNWIATEDGMLTISISSDKGWQYVVNNMTSYDYGDYYTSADETVVSTLVIEVKKGDVIEIKVVTFDSENPWAAPAGKVVTNLAFEKAKVVAGETLETVIGSINDATEGTKEPIELPAYDKETGDVTATVLPSDVLEAAKGKDVSVLMNMGKYSWLVNGKDITDTTPINLEVALDVNVIAKELVDAIAKGNTTYQISLSHDGDFGFKATLNTVIGKDYAGKNAVLYWNNDGKLEKAGECKVAEDGSVAYVFEHASDYVVVVEDTTVIDPTGDASTMIYVILLMGVALVGAGFVAKKRFA